LLGNLYRDGHVYSTGIIEVYDHDFPYLADGIVIPHTIYDLRSNEAYVNIGVSKDTSEFACDSIKLWWESHGKIDYPNCTSILILADGGGSNSSRHYIFKEDLQKLVDEIEVEIRIAHYPPYTSKWNPVEHRVFPHITRSLRGVILKSHDFVKKLIESTTTQAGLKVTATIIKKVYKTGRKYSENFKETMRIIFDDYLGKWNYTAIPKNA
jgi:Rhodopirellula transposase DDE domain